MIVQCPSCSTKYNLPDDKVKEGAKLRCSVCKNVFPLSGPADMEAPAEPAAPEPEPEAPDLESELPGAATEEEVFSSTYNEEEDIDFGDFGDLGLEGLDDLDEETTADAAASGDEVDFGDLGLDEETPEFGPAEMDTEEGEDEDSFEDIFGKKEVPEDLGVDIDEQEAEEEEAVAQARVSRGEDLFDIDAQEKKRATEVEKKKTKKKGNPVVSAVFFALLLLGAGVVVAYLYFPDVLRSIPIVGGFVESPAEPDQPGEPDQPAQPEQAAPEEQGAVANIEDLALKDIQQNYVENEKVGELFVVQGSVVNNFQSPKELIKVEASLFDQNGVPVVTKTQLIGNTLTLFQLQMLSMEEIEKELQDKVGIVTANTNVEPGGDVPFVVVFANPPQNVAEFGVKIVEAKDPPADQNQ